ncbi:MAG: heme ABC transporter ATP-binding protein [Acidimicrobiales bacterium mtb01]|nr:ABC transporter ATP-binding protein [Actinomycetota bacterium]TEX46599.1 MAG: heme ABC transporter ATP-binding protein [Acidimicrobiales bacterium mtb01]
MKSAVRMTGIVKRFPGVVANDGVDVDIRAGEVHALLGENGAGKSTLSNILTGLYRPDDGTVEIDGHPMQFSSPRDALEAGIGMVHQHFRLVSTFTVAENVVLGEPDSPFMMDAARVAQQVKELSDRYGLAVDPSARIWQLSVGEQQRVEIIKVLYRGAKVLILDEPTAVLTPIEADALFKTLRAMVAEGRTVIFISHKLDEVIKVSDRVTVLRGGKTVGTVETASTNTRELASLMVGRSVEFNRIVRSNPADVAHTVLTLDGVSARDDRGREALHDISLMVGRGEIVGVAGVAGNGQRELAEVISGMRPLSTGRIDVAGESVQSGRARSAIAKGIAHIPEDRLHTGLASSHSVEDNLALKNYRSSSLSKFRVLRRKAIRAQAADLVRSYDVKTPDTVTPVRLLSGGNVQKVLLAREFSSLPKVLIAASPTRGLDVGAIETVRARLVEAAERGVGILLISEDLDEIMSLADRIVVMYEGRLVDEVAAEAADRERLGLTMGGSTVSGGAR